MFLYKSVLTTLSSERKLLRNSKHKHSESKLFVITVLSCPVVYFIKCFFKYIIMLMSPPQAFLDGWSSQIWTLLHHNTQPVLIFNRENLQNFRSQNDPRRGLDFIALCLSDPQSLVQNHCACNLSFTTIFFVKLINLAEMIRFVYFLTNQFKISYHPCAIISCDLYIF